MILVQTRRQRTKRSNTKSGERKALIKPILNLPPDSRDVFLLHCMAGLSYERIQERLSITADAVQSHLAEAILLLATLPPTSERLRL